MNELTSPEPDCPEDFFKRDFPSLKGIIFVVLQDRSVRRDDGIWLSEDEEVIPTSIIQKHCLDKERVREAIEKYIDCGDSDDALTKHIFVAVNNAMTDLKKALGLK